MEGQKKQICSATFCTSGTPCAREATRNEALSFCCLLIQQPGPEEITDGGKAPSCQLWLTEPSKGYCCGQQQQKQEGNVALGLLILPGRVESTAGLAKLGAGAWSGAGALTGVQTGALTGRAAGGRRHSRHRCPSSPPVHALQHLHLTHCRYSAANRRARLFPANHCRAPLANRAAPDKPLPQEPQHRFRREAPCRRPVTFRGGI